MAVLWIIVQLWLLCCGTYVAAGLLGFDALFRFRAMPALAAAFLLLRTWL